MQYLVKLMQFSTFISAFYHKGIRVCLSGNLTYAEFIVQRENALLIDYKVFFTGITMFQRIIKKQLSK